MQLLTDLQHFAGLQSARAMCRVPNVVQDCSARQLLTRPLPRPLGTHRMSASTHAKRCSAWLDRQGGGRGSSTGLPGLAEGHGKGRLGLAEDVCLKGAGSGRGTGPGSHRESLADGRCCGLPTLHTSCKGQPSVQQHAAVPVELGYTTMRRFPAMLQGPDRAQARPAQELALPRVGNRGIAQQ